MLEAIRVAAINSITYRGYFYDSEIGMYYLQSRYYDPEVGRFINADDTKVLEDTREIIFGVNLYSYCKNNPINSSDPTGEWHKDDHANITKNSPLASSFESMVIIYNKKCDERFQSTSTVTYPFHSRGEVKINNSVKLLYRFAKDIYRSNIKKTFSYNDLFKTDGFTCLDKTQNDSPTSSIAKKYNNQILNYINSTPKTAREQAAVLLGFCLHILQDYFAHRVAVKCKKVTGNEKYITISEMDAKLFDIHGTFKRCSLEDNKKIFSWRYDEATAITRRLIANFTNFKNISSLTFTKTTSKKYSHTIWIGLFSRKIETYHHSIAIKN